MFEECRHPRSSTHNSICKAPKKNNVSLLLSISNPIHFQPFDKGRLFKNENIKQIHFWSGTTLIHTKNIRYEIMFKADRPLEYIEKYYFCKIALLIKKNGKTLNREYYVVLFFLATYDLREC